MRKVYYSLTVRVIANVDEGVDANDVINNMEYDMISQTDGAEIEDTEICDFKIMESK